MKHTHLTHKQKQPLPTVYYKNAKGSIYGKGSKLPTYDSFVEITEQEYNTHKAAHTHRVNPNLKEIARLKAELAKYDYIGVKIAMGVATAEDYADEIAHTEELRKQIRALEA